MQPQQQEVRPLAERVRRVGVRRHPLGDLYHFLMTTKWRHLFALVAAFYLAANALFALGYYVDGGIENARADSYLDAFFFSVQTMATIGYGKLVPHSIVANTLVTIEALFGMLVIAMGSGLMFAKFSRPSARVLFSRYAVVSTRNGKRSLMVRIANERATGIVEAEMHLALLRDEVTIEGERLRRPHTLTLVRSSSVMFALSWTAVHVIDETSPLFGADAEELRAAHAELIFSLVGYDDATMATVHVRHTWTSSQVLIGKRFADIISISEDGYRVIDYAKFDDVEDAQK
jgi:inward rectifier potassium channel